MHIDDAITMLRAEKKRGVKHVLISHWTADQFGRTDNSIWNYLADAVMEADWGHINDTLDEMVEEAVRDQEIAPEDE